MICAQKVSLTSWLQDRAHPPPRIVGCDLRSKSIFDILITGKPKLLMPYMLLWFALKKYLWHPDYRGSTDITCVLQVVICAQKVSLTSWLQVGSTVIAAKYSCDLRSKSIFDILITGSPATTDRILMLWFALKKYLWHPDYRQATRVY